MSKEVFLHIKIEILWRNLKLFLSFFFQRKVLIEFAPLAEFFHFTLPHVKPWKIREI